MSSVNTTDEVVGEFVSIEGFVKWFDPVKGYGFIVPNDGGVDVLVHNSTLRRGGYDILYPRARIKCAIIQRQQGFQADKIIAVDNSEAIIPTGNPCPTGILSDIIDVSDF
jgi:CspA family cold shock protein